MFFYRVCLRFEYVITCVLSCQTRDVAFKALGWSIRYFMVMRDNYFGSFTHFSTLYEYLDKRRRGLPIGDPITQKYREGRVSEGSFCKTITAELGFTRPTSSKLRWQFSSKTVYWHYLQAYLATKCLDLVEIKHQKVLGSELAFSSPSRACKFNFGSTITLWVIFI